MRTDSNQYRKPGIGLMLIIPALLLFGVGCGDWGSSIVLPKNERLTVPWKLNLNHRAITLAVGESVQLAIEPRNAEGEALDGLPPVVYSVTDTTLKVDDNGRLTATAANPMIIVTATMSSVEGNWTIREEARVTVVEEPYEFSGFKMELNGPSPVPANRARRFDSFLYDASGEPVLNSDGSILRPTTYYTSSVPATIYRMTNNWTATGATTGVGKPTIVGTAYIFGQVYKDSVQFQTTYPDSASLNIYRVSTSLNPSPSMMSRKDHTILKGGKITFVNQNPTLSSDIVFDDQTNTIGGNIPSVPSSPGQAVTFPVAGKFTYKSSHGFGGTITVVEWPDD